MGRKQNGKAWVGHAVPKAHVIVYMFTHCMQLSAAPVRLHRTMSHRVHATTHHMLHPTSHSFPQIVKNGS